MVKSEKYCSNHAGHVGLIKECVLNHENSEGPFTRLGKYPWSKCEGWIMIGCAGLYLQGTLSIMQHYYFYFTGEGTKFSEKSSAFTKATKLLVDALR